MNTGSIEALLAERGKQHGDFSDHARISQSLKLTMKASKNWATLSPIMAESLEMIQHKIARILSGDPNHNDHWDDLAGYAKLVSDRTVPVTPTPKTIGGVGAYGDETRQDENFHPTSEQIARHTL